MLFRKQNRTVLGSQHVKKVKAINTKFSIFGFIVENMELSCIHLALREHLISTSTRKGR